MKSPAGAAESRNTGNCCRPCGPWFVLVLPAVKTAGYFRSSLCDWNLGRKFFTVRLVVAVPAGQGGVAGVFKKKLQRRRFDVAVAKYHVGFALMTLMRCESKVIKRVT